MTVTCGVFRKARPVHNRSIYFTMVLFPFVAACTREDAPGVQEVLRADSAGVEIVLSPAQGVGSWNLDAEPILSIGEGEEPESVFQFAFDVRWDDAGRLIVADDAGGRVAVFDSIGEYVRDLGRRGEGPGEYRVPFRLFPSSEALYVYDLSGQVLAFSVEGDFVDSWRVPPELRRASTSPEEMPVSQEVNYLGDGTFLFGTGITSTRTAGLTRELVRLSRWWPASDRIDTLGWYPGAEMHVVRGELGQPQARTPHLGLGGGLLQAAGSGLVHVSDGTFFGFHSYDANGELVRVARVDAPLRPADERVRERWRENRSQWWRGGGQEGVPVGQLQRMYEETPFVDSLPPFGEIRVDRDGRLWAQEVPDRDWEVWPAQYHLFAPDGVYLGTIRMPDRFRVTDAAGSYVVGVHWGDLDVRSVRLYHFVRDVS